MGDAPGEAFRARSIADRDFDNRWSFLDAVRTAPGAPRPGVLALVVLAAACGARTSLDAPGSSPDDGGDATDLDVGCADGQREAFLDASLYVEIAGCAGGWDRPGVYDVAEPTCGRTAGDDGARPDGEGCRVEDLCAVGWHVCTSAAEVAEKSPDGCAGADAIGGSFFVTRQSGSGCGACATGSRPGCTGNDCLSGCAPNDATTNDIFGCGSVGDAPWEPCGVLSRYGYDQCKALPPPWDCDDHGDGTREARVVVKPGPDVGGVICCRR